jgi:hypothetical protein
MTEVLNFVNGTLTDPYDKLLALILFMMFLEMFVSFFAILMKGGHK